MLRSISGLLLRIVVNAAYEAEGEEEEQWLAVS